METTKFMIVNFSYETKQAMKGYKNTYMMILIFCLFFFFFSFGNGKREVTGPMRYMEERNVKLNEITCFAGLWACFFQNLERKKERLLVVTKERLVFKKEIKNNTTIFSWQN